MQTNKIVLLIPYYGQWPQWHDLFLESCKANQFIDFMYITDMSLPQHAPHNVKVYNLSFEALKKLIEQKLEVSLPEIEPYKLCDFRPAYGVVFEELIKDYSFWGYGDNDLIYGDLNQFIPENILKDFDIFSFRKNHLQGPLTFYKNESKVNSLFLISENWKTIFTNKTYLSFDEFGQQGFHLQAEKSIDFFDNDNISVIALKEKKKGTLNLYMEDLSKEVICDTKERLEIKNHQVINYKTKQTYAFYHWVWEKRAIWFEYPNWETAPKVYYISETGFYSKDAFRFYFFIHHYRKTIGFCKWLILKIRNYIVRRLHIGQVYVDTYPRVGFIKKIHHVK